MFSCRTAIEVDQNTARYPLTLIVNMPYIAFGRCKVKRKVDRNALPEYPRVLFAKAPLKSVIGQIRFPVLPRFSEGSFIAPFQEAVKSDYPLAEREHRTTLRVSGPAGVEAGVAQPQWQFQSRDQRWSLGLSESAVTLEVSGYTSIDDFLARFMAVLETSRSTLGVSERLRLGLRYINEIRHPDAATLTDWAKLLSPDFIGFAGSDLVGGDVENSRHELIVRRCDGTLAVRHGLLTAVGTEMPSFYLIDLDYYDDVPVELDIQKTLDRMRAYNDFMYRLFRWAIGDKLYDFLEPRDAY